MTKTSEIIAFLDKVASPELAEEWDNVGLLVGSSKKDIKRVLLSLDVTSSVVEEAVSQKVDMIIAHHPVIFKGLKRVTEDDVQSKLVYKLIRSDINVFAAHTNLDVALSGINQRLAVLLNLKNIENLSAYKQEKLYKLAVFVPSDSTERVHAALCSAGAGWIGNYSDCTFQSQGIGTFTPLEGTNPYIGFKGELSKVQEVKLETIVPEKLLKGVVKSMLEAHPYEEVAYDIYPLKNTGLEYGLGKVGELDKIYSFKDFTEYLKIALKVDGIRCTGNPPEQVNKVAVFCGSFDEDYIECVKKHRPDILITGDLKHHMAIDLMENEICAVDCGHFGTEKVVMELFHELLVDEFSEVNFIISENCKSPILTI